MIFFFFLLLLNLYSLGTLYLVLVSTSVSSLYYDEDGDLAHEFYEETVVTKNGRKKAKLKRIQKNLIPQVTLLRQNMYLVCLLS